MRISVISDVPAKLLPSVIFRSGICLEHVQKIELLTRDVTRTETLVPSGCEQCKNATVSIFLWYRRYQTYNFALSRL